MHPEELAAGIPAALCVCFLLYHELKSTTSVPTVLFLCMCLPACAYISVCVPACEFGFKAIKHDCFQTGHKVPMVTEI